MEGTPATSIKTEAGSLFMMHISNHYVVHMKLTQCEVSIISQSKNNFLIKLKLQAWLDPGT